MSKHSVSYFLTEVHGPDGVLKYSAWRGNLTLDGALGFSNRRDWEAKALGGGLAPVATMVGFATSVTATSLTNTGATFPTSGQGLAGQIVAVGPNNAGAGSTVFGVIIANTATVLTVDQWYSPGTLNVGATPSATASYQVLPGQMPAMWLALSTDSTTPASTDTTLAGEITTNGLNRAIAIWSHTAATSTYQLQHVFSATGTATINKEGVFAAANGGAFPFESQEPNPPVLSKNDQLTQTVVISI